MSDEQRAETHIQVQVALVVGVENPGSLSALNCHRERFEELERRTYSVRETQISASVRCA